MELSILVIHLDPMLTNVHDKQCIALLGAFT